MMRSWTQEERESGGVHEASSPINMGICFKGIWAANCESEEDQERVGILEGFKRVQERFALERNSAPALVPRPEFSLTIQINKRRRGCFWIPFQRGRELAAVEVLESRKHTSSEHGKTRGVALLALLVSVASVVVAILSSFFF